MDKFKSATTSSRTFLSADHPISGLEPFHRQLEKERIRQEIIANEMAQRKILEAEVMMELRMEREAGMLKSGYKDPSFMAFAERSAVPRVTLPDKRSLEDMVSKMIDEKLAVLFPGLRKSGADVMPVKEEAYASDLPVEVEVDRIVFQAKPKDEAESSGVKREMEVSEELPAVDKKVKHDWRCEICQSMASSEVSLLEHYKGKKHKSKQAAFEAHGNAKNFSIGLSPKSPKLESSSDAEEDAKPKEMTAEAESYPFWCGICKVGTYSPKVMEDHKGGRMHLKAVRLMEEKSRSDDHS